jgi:hypothetical protein
MVFAKICNKFFKMSTGLLDNTPDAIEKDRKWIESQLSLLLLDSVGVVVIDTISNDECDYFILSRQSLSVGEEDLSKLLRYPRHTLVKWNIKVPLYSSSSDTTRLLYEAEEMTWAIMREAYPIKEEEEEKRPGNRNYLILSLWILIIALVLYKWFE